MNKKNTLIIAVAHQKGGTGKTTTVCNLAACLGMASDGLRIAVVDLDAQGTATSHLNGASYFESDSYQVIVGTISISEAALPTGIRNCFVVPSTNSLVLCEMDPVVRALSFNEVRERLIGGENAFDVIIIDCPSGLGIISTMAIAVSDLVIMPTPPLAFAEKPLRATIDYINNIKENTESAIAIVLTMYEPEISSQKKLAGQMRDEWGRAIVDVEIPFEALVEDAVENNAVVIEFEKRSAISLAYIKMTEDMGRRLGLDLDISRLDVNSFGADLIHGLGCLIEPHGKNTDLPPAKKREPPTETKPVSENSCESDDNRLQISPEKVNATLDSAKKLPENMSKARHKDKHYTSGINNSTSLFRDISFIILILILILLMVSVPFN